MIVSCADYIFYFFDGCKLMSNEYTYVMPFRDTNMGALTKYIAVCMMCRKIIKPADIRRSRRGTHGEDYYTHEHELKFILLHSSNSGKRAVLVPDELRPIQNDLEKMWIYENVSVHEIIEFISSYLQNL